MNPFDFVNSINSNKRNLIKESDDPETAEAEYVPYIVNRSLSYFADTVLYANEMNKLQVNNKAQYLYLLNTIRPAKRFSKWVKREDQADVDAVSEYFKCSPLKAIQAINILQPDDLQRIKQKLQRGGNK